MQKKVFNSSLLILSHEPGGIRALAIEQSIFNQRVVFSTVFDCDEQNLARKLQELMTHEDFMPQDVIYCPDVSLSVQQSFSLPAIAAANLSDVVSLELRKHFPLSFDQLCIGWDSPASEESIANEPVADDDEALSGDDDEKSGDGFFVVSACAIKRDDLEGVLAPFAATQFNPDYVCTLPMLLGRGLDDKVATLLLLSGESGECLVSLYLDKVLVEGVCLSSEVAVDFENVVAEARKLAARHRVLLGVGGVGRVLIADLKNSPRELRSGLATAFGVEPLPFDELCAKFPEGLDVEKGYLPLLVAALAFRPESLNLWEKDDKKLRLKRSTKIIAGLGGVLFCLLALLIGYGFFAQWLRVSNLKSELEELAPQISTVSKLQAQNGARRLLIKRTRDLAAKNFSALRFLQRLSDLFPEHTFLIRVSVNVDKNEIKISGYSMDIESLEELVASADFIDNTKLLPPKIRNKFFEYYIFDWDLALKPIAYDQLIAEKALTANPPSSMLPPDHFLDKDKKKSRVRNIRSDDEDNSENAEIEKPEVPQAAPAVSGADSEVKEPAAATAAKAVNNEADDDDESAENQDKKAASQEALTREEVDEIFRDIVSKMFEDYMSNQTPTPEVGSRGAGGGSGGQGAAPEVKPENGAAKDKAGKDDKPDPDDLGWPVSNN